MSTPVLEISNLRKSFGDEVVLQNISLSELFGEHALVEKVAQPDVRRQVAVQICEVRANGILLKHAGKDVASIEEDALDVVVADRGLDALHPHASPVRKICIHANYLA